MSNPLPEELEERHETGGGGHGGASGRWLVSYADFITLMMVVFMVLYSMAKVDSTKYGQLKASLASSSIGTPLPVGGNPINTAPVQPGPDMNSAPGNPAPADPANTVPAPLVPPVSKTEATTPAAEQPAATSPSVGTGSKDAPAQTSTKPATTTPATPAKDPMQSTKDRFQSTAAARAGALTVHVEDRGVVVSILTSVLFADGQSELKAGSTGVLDEISTQLKAGSDSVLVEGSPDAGLKDAPWDLSSKRASAVVSYLVSKHGLASDRFNVIGYGKGAGVNGIVNVVVMRKSE